VATGAQLVSYSGFSASNYLEQPYSANLDFGTGDFCVMGWFSIPSAPATAAILSSRIAPGLTGAGFEIFVDSNLKIELATTTAGFSPASSVISAVAVATNTPVFAMLARRSGVLEVWINGIKDANTTASTDNVSSATATTRFGIRQDSSFPFSGWMSMWRISATPPSADQIAQIYRDELALFQTGAQCVIDGNSGQVTALAYDDVTDLLHAGTSWGRSAFRGLQRVESSATSVGAIAALGAVNGMYISGGASAARFVAPTITLRDELRRKEEARRAMLREEIPIDFDGGSGQTTFTLPIGFSTKNVFVTGTKKRVGSTKDYTISFDGYRESVVFGTSPGTVWVQITANRSL
jgi:hypothetical protein